MSHFSRLSLVLVLLLASRSLHASPLPDDSLSSDQAAFEALELRGGDFALDWNFPYGSGPLISGTHYLIAVASGGLHQSPFTDGPQIQNPQTISLDAALAVRANDPLRILHAGQVLLLPDAATRRVSYSGDGVTIDHLAPDGGILLSERLSQFRRVSLDRYLEHSPDEFQAAIPIRDWVRDGHLSGSAKWRRGSEYVTWQAVRHGDVFVTQDCGNSFMTSDNSALLPIPCARGAKIESIFPISLGTQLDNAPETLFATDGSITEREGVRMWIAHQPIPLGQFSTERYRVFFEFDQNVYRGSLEKDGTQINVMQADGSVVPHSVVLNQAAISSIEAGLITGAGVPETQTQVQDTSVVRSIDLFGIGGHGPNGSLSPADLRAHYDIPDQFTGEGQTIAIVGGPVTEDIEADLATFSDHYRLPRCESANSCFHHIDLGDGAVAPSFADWNGEVALDTQMIHAIAPKAKIVLVTAAPSTGGDGNLMDAINTAAAIPGVLAVSMSFGLRFNDQATEDPKLADFQRERGLIFIAATGDDGNDFDTLTSLDSSPYVTTVGGTRIRSVSRKVSGESEVAWEFSVGGTAAQTVMPAWQKAIVSPAVVAANSGRRAFPDVSAVADFRDSAFGVYYQEGWKMQGGTSAAAPLWAGVTALFGQYLEKKGKSLPALVKSTAGGFNGLLYRSKLLQGRKPGLQDIISGSNDIDGSTCAICTAQPGYDNVTGLGAPDVARLFSSY